MRYMIVLGLLAVGACATGPSREDCTMHQGYVYIPEAFNDCDHVWVDGEVQQ